MQGVTTTIMISIISFLFDDEIPFFSYNSPVHQVAVDRILELKRFEE